MRRLKNMPQRRRVLALALCVCPFAIGAGLAAPEQTADSCAVTLISIERDCFGCTAGERLVLRRDGQASLVLTGKARHRTQEQVSLGRLAVEDFEALARLTLAQGFMALHDSYDDPQSRDGAWTTLTVACRAGATKQVFRRKGEGPAALDVIEAALRDLQGRISFR
jgi:hypothetical protein